MDIAITKMSTKGQIVIPAEIRAEFDVGEKILLIKTEGSVIIKKATKMDKQLKEDLEAARRAEKAWKLYEKGEFLSKSADDFLAELKKC
jgi:AbrB family looped-hinge helix DNA binding protein